MTRGFTQGLMAILCAVAVLGPSGADTIDATDAVEDIAYQTVHRLNGDKRVCEAVKTIAFVKLDDDNGATSWRSHANLPVVFETALAATPGRLKFVVHTSRDADWEMIDEIFRQARDMSSWDPKTCPQLKKLKLCDALLLGQLIRSNVDEKAGEIEVKMALRLIQVSTGEELWGSVVESHRTLGGPDDEQVSLNWRRALDSCAADAVAKLPKALEGYGILILPIKGRSGTAMEQVFLNALTAAGKQDRIAVYDLPRGNVQDRMFARFLGDRGSQTARDEDFERRSIGQYVTARKLPAKLAMLSGMVSVVNEHPRFELSRDGLPVDFLGGAAAAEAQQRKSYEVICDFKFRDVNDSFRLLGSIGATGVYSPDATVSGSWLARLRAYIQELDAFFGDGAVVRTRNVVVAILLILLCVHLIRRIVRSRSRPR